MKKMQLPTKINLDDSNRPNDSLRHAFRRTKDTTASQNDDDRHDPDADSSLRATAPHRSGETLISASQPQPLRNFTRQNLPCPRASARRCRLMPPLLSDRHRGPAQAGSTRKQASEDRSGLVALTPQVCYSQSPIGQAEYSRCAHLIVVLTAAC